MQFLAGRFKSTKFSEAPDSTKIWTVWSANRPSATAALRLDRAQARHGFSIDETETTACEGANLHSFSFLIDTRAKCSGLSQLKQVAARAEQVYRGWNGLPQKEHLTWRLDHLFIRTSLCDNGRTWGRRTVQVAIRRIVKRYFQTLTVKITFAGQQTRQRLWLSHRQSLALISVQALSQFESFQSYLCLLEVWRKDADDKPLINISRVNPSPYLAAVTSENVQSFKRFKNLQILGHSFTL